MTIDSGIVFGIISLAGSLLIAAAGYGAMKQKVENILQGHYDYKKEHSERHEKEDEITREKFKELYGSRNNTALAVERLGVLMEQVFKSLGELNVKVDKILSREKDA